MKKKSYYRTTFNRNSVLKRFFMGLFLAYCSWPRLLLEVFLRRNFGERYFSFSTAMILAIALGLTPVVAFYMSWDSPNANLWVFFGASTTLYLYLAAFVYMCLKRRDEVKRLPSVFDFARFSLSTGEINPWFYKLRFNGQPVSVRTIEIWIEPGICFLIGLFLAILGQPVGQLLIHCSIFYGLSYKAAYYEGDHYIMDQIDEQICNQELVKTFVDGPDSDETRGFRFYGRIPADPEARRRLAETFSEEEEMVEAL